MHIRRFSLMRSVILFVKVNTYQEWQPILMAAPPPPPPPTEVMLLIG